MTINEVIKNLDNTISGKESFLPRISESIIRGFVEINIEELKRIRDDLIKVRDQS